MRQRLCAWREGRGPPGRYISGVGFTVQLVLPVWCIPDLPDFLISLRISLDSKVRNKLSVGRVRYLE
ncbi:hypothetical protein J6590_037329 [Homalodisca vitripennis]|nr:hypothetical protein J6590_037329 [Homalodisca vitripennis]